MPKTPLDEITNVTAYFTRNKKFRMCRKMGHCFRPTHEDYFVDAAGLYYQRLQCIGGCELTATDTWHPRTMDRVGNRSIDYSTQPDYLAKGTHISRQDYRLWELETRSVRDESRAIKRGRRKQAG